MVSAHVCAPPKHICTSKRVGFLHVVSVVASEIAKFESLHHIAVNWGTWWALDGGDSVGPLTALDAAAGLNAQVQFVQQQQYVHPAGVSMFQCFLLNESFKHHQDQT